MLSNYVTGNNLTPIDVNEKMKVAKGFYGAMIIWSAIPKALPELTFVWRGYNYSNIQVSNYVYLRKLPVLVEVNPGKSLAVARHWCLFTGFQKMIDPWSGTIKSTSTFPATGYALIKKS
jgi:hypothetical protein